MREILFRAKHIHAFNSNSYLDGQWVEGFLSAENYINDGVSDVLIDPNTICQYTGLTDKNGNKIWENDVANVHVFHEIAEGHGTHVNEKGVICYDKIGMLSVAVDITDGIPCYSDILFQAEIAGIGFDIEVIGNIFDNPDLLKGE
jgi:uncharacterized phage protein (TIGR01671 family)